MNPRRLTRTLVVLSLMWAGILFAHQQHIRRIPFRLDLPIAERLLPEDELVIIEESPVPPGRVASGIAPLKAEFDRLAVSEAAVVVEVTNSEGVLNERGSWLRTRVHSLVRHAIQSTDVSLGSAPGVVTWEYDGGEASVKGVAVQAGVFPRFETQRRYLVFLGYSRSQKAWILTAGFTIDSGERVGRLKQSNGSDYPLESALYGLPLDRVIAELESRRK